MQFNHRMTVSIDYFITQNSENFNTILNVDNNFFELDPKIWYINDTFIKNLLIYLFIYLFFNIIVLFNFHHSKLIIALNIVILI